MIENDPMDETQDDNPPINRQRAQELGRKFERLIVGAVATKFNIPPENLKLLNDTSAEFLEKPGEMYFRVLDRPGNDMYGVVAMLQEDGTLADYLCDVIPL